MIARSVPFPADPDDEPVAGVDDESVEDDDVLGVAADGEDAGVVVVGEPPVAELLHPAIAVTPTSTRPAAVINFDIYVPLQIGTDDNVRLAQLRVPSGQSPETGNVTILAVPTDCRAHRLPGRTERSS